VRVSVTTAGGLITPKGAYLRMVSIPSPSGDWKEAVMPTLQSAPRARRAELPRTFHVVIRGADDRIIASDLGWDAAVERAGRWNCQHGTALEWAWLVPVVREGVAA
jgi:hypothetical protein